MSRPKLEQTDFLATASDVAEALRALTQQILDDALPGPAGPVPLGQLRQLKLKLSPAGDRWMLELTVKVADAATEEPGEAGERFKDVKKRMRRTFKALRALLQEGTLPPSPLRQSFREDCARMRELAPSPDPAYDTFLALAEQLLAATTLEEARGLIEPMREHERSCHHHYR